MIIEISKANKAKISQTCEMRLANFSFGKLVLYMQSMVARLLICSHNYLKLNMTVAHSPAPVVCMTEPFFLICISSDLIKSNQISMGLFTVLTCSFKAS